MRLHDYVSLPSNPSGGMPHGQKGWDDAARAAGYQDMYKNIEAMRQDAFAKEVKEGEFTPEFGQLNFDGMATGILLMILVPLVLGASSGYMLAGWKGMLLGTIALPVIGLLIIKKL